MAMHAFARDTRGVGASHAACTQDLMPRLHAHPQTPRPLSALLQIWLPPPPEGGRGRQVFLGSYDTAIDAAQAYDRAAICIFKERAMINVRTRVYLTVCGLHACARARMGACGWRMKAHGRVRIHAWSRELSAPCCPRGLGSSHQHPGTP